MSFIVAGFIVLILLFSAIKILNEYERGVIFTLGRYTGTKGPGIIIVIPFVQRMVKVILGLEAEPRSSHEADAFAVAVCHALASPLAGMIP